MKKNIIFFITAFGHGKGGHFYSLKTISEELSKFYSCYIISVGPSLSPIIKDISNIKVIHYHYKAFNHINILIKINQYLKEEIRNFSVDSIIHAFDENAYAFARIIGKINNIPTALTKCGGPNPKGYYPKCQNMILFSQENYDYFSMQIGRKGRVSLIPNRSVKIKADKSRILRLRKEIGIEKDTKVILRIGRIDSHYEAAIFQSIEFYRFYRLLDKNVALIFVGVIQNEQLFRKIVDEIKNEKIFLVTKDEFTYQASDLIDIADYVIGTGRGLMEAASLSKIIFTPNIDSKLPIILNTETFNQLLKSNFSPRNKIIIDNEKYEIQLVKLFENDNYRGQLAKETFKLFEEYFSVEQAIMKYQAFYNHLSSRIPFSIVDTVINNFYFLLRVLSRKL